jgi:hypothetical protein
MCRLSRNYRRVNLLEPQGPVQASNGIDLPREGYVVNATPRPLYPREWPGTHCLGGWVGPGSGLAWKISPHRDSKPDRLAHSELLYRLRCLLSCSDGSTDCTSDGVIFSTNWNDRSTMRLREASDSSTAQDRNEVYLYVSWPQDGTVWATVILLCSVSFVGTAEFKYTGITARQNTKLSLTN